MNSICAMKLFEKHGNTFQNGGFWSLYSGNKKGYYYLPVIARKRSL